MPGAETSMTQGEGMKQMVGSPGTWSGMALRVSQCVFAAVSLRAMVTAFDFPDIMAFRLMNTMMLLQMVWSLGLACFDIYAMRNTKVLHKHALLRRLVVGDWTMAALTSATAWASYCVATIIVENVDFCGRKAACGPIALPIVLACISSLFAVTSLLHMVSLQASFPQ